MLDAHAFNAEAERLVPARVCVRTVELVQDEQMRAPAGEVAGRAPESAGRARPSVDERSLGPLAEEPARERLLCVPRRPAQRERLEEQSLDRVLERLAHTVGDELAEHEVAEVRVMEASGRQDALSLVESRDDLLPCRKLEGRPGVARQLTLESRRVREQLPRRSEPQRLVELDAQ